MTFDREQSRHESAYDMSLHSSGFGYEAPLNGMAGQALSQPAPGWIAVPPPPPPPQQQSLTPTPKLRAIVAIFSLIVLLPISITLFTSGDVFDYTALVSRLIAMGMVCATIVAINLAFYGFKR